MNEEFGQCQGKIGKIMHGCMSSSVVNKFYLISGLVLGGTRLYWILFLRGTGLKISVSAK